MKKIFYCCVIFVLSTHFLSAQNVLPKDSIAIIDKNNADSLFASKVNDRARSDIESISKVFEDFKTKSSAAEAELKELRRKIERYTNKLKLSNDTLNIINKNTNVKRDSLKAVTDSLDKVKHFLNTLSDSLDTRTKVLDSTKTEIDEKKKEIKEKEKEVAQFEQDRITAMAELSKVEDSLEVIAKIALVNRNYVYLDRAGLVKELNTETVRKDISLRREILKGIGPQGFRLFSGDEIEKMAIDKDYAAIPDTFRKKIKIDEVNIDVHEGVIREIIVKTTYGIYRNQNSPIDLVRIGRRLDDRLPRDGEIKYRHEYMKLGEVIEYIPKRSFSDLPYTQFNMTLLPDTLHKKDRYWIRESTSINTYFDVAIFTDIKGISGEPNGLAQMSGNAKFITNTRNVKNAATILGNFVAFTGGISKFDNAFKGTPLESGDSINRRDLLQRSNFYVGIKANIFHAIAHPYPKRLIQDIQLNIGFNYIGSKVLKSFSKDEAFPEVLDTTYSNVTHNQIYLEPIVALARYRNFNMTVSAPISLINIKESSGITNNKSEIWIRPSIELMYFSHRSSSNKIFFKYNHWINLKTRADAFLQAQLGYSANITDLFSGK